MKTDLLTKAHQDERGSREEALSNQPSIPSSFDRGLPLTRPLNVLDCETTGLNIACDRIVELVILQLRPDCSEVTFCWKFNPGISVPAKAVAVHGLSDEELKNCPSFSENAPDVLKVIRGCDLAGFNVVNFDVPLLWEEFHRAGFEWDLEDTKIVDVATIFRAHESRTLAHALRFYCGREHSGAHGALADAHATLDVLNAELRKYPDLAGKDIPALAKAYGLNGREDLAGLLTRDRAGQCCYNLGVIPFDHSTGTGLKVQDDPRLAEWALSASVPVHTKLVLRRALAAASSKPAQIARRGTRNTPGI